jgi:hypothetical protein
VWTLSHTSSALPSQFQLSQNSSTEERPNDATSDGQVTHGASNAHLQASQAIETVLSAQYSSTETTSFSTTFSTAKNGPTVSATTQASTQTSTKSISATGNTTSWLSL